MIIEWLNPILEWTGLGLVPFLIVICILLLIINILRG